MTGKPGDLVAIPFPYTDLKAQKRRPVVMLSMADTHGNFIAVAVTSVPTHELAVAVTNGDLSEGELPKPSWVRCNKLFTLSVGFVVKRYGTLEPEKLKEILAALRSYLGCRVTENPLGG
jgi:mRNA interferase MazF